MIRGLHTHNGVLHAVIDSSLYSVDSAGSSVFLGSLSSTAGPVDFASLLNQLVITDGGILYVWNGTSLLTVAGFFGGLRVGFVDQRIVYPSLNSQIFRWSELADATNLPSLNFASAEGATDNLVSLVTDHGEVWLFGEYTTEIWNSVGGEEVFARNRSAFIEYGCAATYTAQKAANSITWLARDENGQAMVMSASGYQPQRISTRAIEERFDGRDLSQSFAFTYSDGPHSYYCLNVPGVDTTLVYDHAFKQWHERAEIAADGGWRQWRPTCHAFAYGRHYFGDADGSIYTLDKTYHKFGDDPKVRSRVMPTSSAPNRERVRYAGLEMVCQTGTAGQAMLRWTDDNGANYSAWRYATTGEIGRLSQRVRWSRLGSAYDRTFEVRFSDDAPWNPVLASVT